MERELSHSHKTGEVCGPGAELAEASNVPLQPDSKSAVASDEDVHCEVHVEPAQVLAVARLHSGSGAEADSFINTVLNQQQLLECKLEVVWENERKLGFGQYSKENLLSSDRPAWSSLHGNPRKPRHLIEPSRASGSSYQWISDWTIDVKTGFTDAQGWQFAPRFNPTLAGWSDKASLIRIVRRRRWLRLKQRASANAVETTIDSVIDPALCSLAVDEHGVRQLAQSCFHSCEQNCLESLGSAGNVQSNETMEMLSPSEPAAALDVHARGKSDQLENNEDRKCPVPLVHMPPAQASSTEHRMPKSQIRAHLSESGGCDGKINLGVPQANSQWKVELARKIVQRDEREMVAYEYITFQYTEIARRERVLLDQAGSLAAEVKELRLQKAALESSLQMVNEHGLSGVEVGKLQQQIFAMQTELLDAYKDRTAAAEMKLKLHQSEQLLLTSSKENERLEAHRNRQDQAISELKFVVDRTNAKCSELAKHNSALHLNLANLETHTRSLELQLMQQKEKSAAAINDMNMLLEHTRREAASKVRAATIDAMTNSEEQPQCESTHNLGLIAIPSSLGRKLQATDEEIYCVATSADGRWAVAGQADRHLRVWDVATGHLKYTLSGLCGAPFCCAFSPSCDFVAASGVDSTVIVWSILTGRISVTLNGHQDKVFGMAFIAEQSLVSGGSDRKIKFWNLKKGCPVRTIPCTTTITDLDVSSTGDVLVSAHQDGSVRFWDAGKGVALHEMLSVHRVPITSISVSPDGSKALTCANDNTFHVIDMATLQDMMTVRHADFQNRHRARACFSPDGEHWAAGSSKSGSVYVWNALTYEECASLPFHHPSASIVCGWSSSGYLVTGCTEGILGVWE